MATPPCHSDSQKSQAAHVPSCHANIDKPDWLLRICAALFVLLYVSHLLMGESIPAGMAHAAYPRSF